MRSAAAHAVAEVVDLAEFRRRRERERTQAAEALSQEQAPRPEMGLSLVWYPVWVCVTPCLGG